MSHSPNDTEHCWYHMVLTFYAAWLPGDPRGFRTRRHKEHVEGDYKRPPAPGQYEARHQRSRENLRFSPAVLPMGLREVVGAAIRDRLLQLDGFVLSVAVAAKHVHALARLPKGTADDAMGKVKRHAWFELRKHGWTRRLWAQKGRATRVYTRKHQLSAMYYILRHEREGAWVWCWSPEQPKRSE